MLKKSILVVLLSSSILISFVSEILKRGVPPRVMEQPAKIKINNVVKIKLVKER